MKQKPSAEQAQQAVKVLLDYIGDDRPELDITPKKVIESYVDLFGGYQFCPSDFFSEKIPTDERGLVVLSHIPFTSVCEHHMLPFAGFFTVGYLPKGYLIGLGTLPRLVKAFSSRLQTQEKLTGSVAKTLFAGMPTEGAAAISAASHACVACRGSAVKGVSVYCSSYHGSFLDSSSLRDEFHLASKSQEFQF